MKLKVIIALSFAWLVIFLGVFLRSYKIDAYPVDNNDDGLFYTWIGLSFWQSPFNIVAHSIFNEGNPNLIWRSQYHDYIPIERFGLKIVEKWLDHPPLGPALISLPAKWLGFTGMVPIPQAVVRLPAILASIFTLWLTYLIAKEWWGEAIARWSLLFLATVPYFVVAHKQSFLENFLTPLFLAGVYWLIKNNLTGMVIVSFLSGWFKVPGFSVGLILAGWLLKKRQKQKALTLVITTAVSLLAYLAFGLITDKAGFIFMLTHQGERGAFVNSFLNGLTVPEFYGPFRDGWYVFGSILGLWLLTKAKIKKYQPFAWFFASWLIVIFLVSGRFNNSPWYRYPLIPFMAMAIGVYVNKAIKANSIFYILPLWLLGLSGFDLLNINLPPLYLRLATLLVMAVYGLKFIAKYRLTYLLTGYLTKIIIFVLVIFNIYVSLRFPTSYCSRERCLAPFKIIVNE